MMKTLRKILLFCTFLGAVCLAFGLFLGVQITAQAAELSNTLVIPVAQPPQTITGTITTVPTEMVQAGQLLTYTIWFSSDNDIPVLRIENDIPNQTTFVPNSIQSKAITATSIFGNPILGNKTLVWTVGESLSANDEVELSFVVTVTTPISNNAIITNLTRFITSTQMSISHDITVTSQPKLTVTMTGQHLALTNIPMVYTVTYGNQGTMTATNLLITDTWTEGLNLVETTLPVIQSQTLTQVSGEGINELPPFNSPPPLVLTFTTMLTTGTLTHVVELASEQGVTATDIFTTIIANPQVVLTQTALVTQALISQTIVYSYQIQNLGDIALDNLILSNTLTGLITTVATLPPSQQIEVTTSYTVPTIAEETKKVVNQAIVINDLAQDTATSEVAITGGRLDFEVTNVATPTVVTQAGQMIAYTYQVTNTGNVTLKKVVFSNKIGPIQSIIDLSPNQYITRVQSYIVRTQDVIPPNSSIVNEVNLVGSDIFNNDLPKIAVATVTIENLTTPTPTETATPIVIPSPTVFSTVTPEITPTMASYLPVVIKEPTPTPTMTPTPNPKIEVKITADKSEANLGQVVQYEYTVRNTGNVSLTQVKVADNRLGEVLTLDTLNAGEVKTATRGYTIGLKDLNSLSNQVQVTSLFREQPVIDADSINVTIPTTQLSLESRNTGKLTIEIYLLTNELVIKCSTENNIKTFCGNIHANITYNIKATFERCNPTNITKSYLPGPVTQKGSC